MDSIREKAIEDLNQFGITGTQVYLIDLIPLIEMIWADNTIQDGELKILEDHVKRHVDNVNTIAGCQVLTLSEAQSFIKRFLDQRPDPDLLKCLRELVHPVRLSSSDNETNKALKRSMLSACLDIAASSVTRYPYGIDDRFNPDEKRCFFEILESLSTAPPAQCPPEESE